MSTLESHARSSGEFAILWEFNYVEDVRHYTSDPTGDSNFSHTEKDVPNVAHIIASSEPLAMAAWQHKYGQHGDMYRYRSHKKLLVIDAQIGVGRP